MLKNACGGARGLNRMAILERLLTNSLLKNSSTESLNRPELFDYAGRTLNMIKDFDTFLGTGNAINSSKEIAKMLADEIPVQWNIFQNFLWKRERNNKTISFLVVIENETDRKERNTREYFLSKIIIYIICGVIFVTGSLAKLTGNESSLSHDKTGYYSIYSTHHLPYEYAPELKGVSREHDETCCDNYRIIIPFFLLRISMAVIGW